MEQSRKLSLQFKHGFIHNTHLFVAMIIEDTVVRNLLPQMDIDELKDWLKKLHANGTVIDEMDSLPLTVHAERNVRHAFLIAEKWNKLEMGSDDLLLSILSYQNEVTALLGKKGIVFENFARMVSSIQLEKFAPYFNVDFTKKLLKSTSFWVFKKDTIGIEKLQEAYRDAFDLYMYGHDDQCIEICDLALAYPNCTDNFKILKALSAISKRDFETARPLFEMLVAENPSNVDFMVSLSYIYGESGFFDKAEILLNKLLLQGEHLDSINNNMGFNLLLQKRYHEAVPYFEKAIELNPLFAYPWDNLGFTLYKLGDKQKAFELIDQSLELDRGNSYSYKFKGIMYMEEGDKEKAMDNFNLALEFGYTKKYGGEVLQLMDELAKR